MENLFFNLYFFLITLITSLKAPDIPNHNQTPEEYSNEETQGIFQSGSSSSSSSSGPSNANQLSAAMLEDIEKKLYNSKTEMKFRFPRIKMEWPDLNNPDIKTAEWRRFCLSAWFQHIHDKGDVALRCRKNTKLTNGQQLITFQQLNFSPIPIDVLKCVCTVQTKTEQITEDTFYLAFLFENSYLEMALEEPPSQTRLKIIAKFNVQVFLD